MPPRTPKVEATVTVELVRRKGRHDATITVKVAGHATTWSGKKAWSRASSLDALHKAIEVLDSRVAKVRRGPEPIGGKALDYFRPAKPPISN